MGTSVSHSSPRTPKWKPVHVGYTNDKIPEEGVLREVWRAADNPTESVRWSVEMKSDIIYACHEIVKSSSSINEALTKFNTEIISSKSNSIAAEFAKRAIPISFQSNNPTSAWVNKFFTEISNYVISRDASGFVGENYRNKNVKELEGFKNRLSSNLNHIMKLEQREIQSRKDWESFIDSTVAKLKSNH